MNQPTRRRFLTSLAAFCAVPLLPQLPALPALTIPQDPQWQLIGHVRDEKLGEILIFNFSLEVSQ